MSGTVPLALGKAMTMRLMPSALIPLAAAGMILPKYVLYEYVSQNGSHSSKG